MESIGSDGVNNGVQDLSLALPDEILEKILALLPISFIFRARAVCRRWNSITTASPRFFSSCSHASSSSSSSQPWYFMFKESQESTQGLVYDPASKKWHNFSLPCHQAAMAMAMADDSTDGACAGRSRSSSSSSSHYVACSNGVACFAEHSQGRLGLYLLNPMTKEWRKVPEDLRRFGRPKERMRKVPEEEEQEEAHVLRKVPEEEEAHVLRKVPEEEEDRWSEEERRKVPEEEDDGRKVPEEDDTGRSEERRKVPEEEDAGRSEGRWKVPEEEEEEEDEEEEEEDGRSSDHYYAVSMRVKEEGEEELEEEEASLVVAVAKSRQLSRDDYSRWRLSVEVLDRGVSGGWRTAASEVLDGWRGGENSAMTSDGLFHCVVHSTTATVGGPDNGRPRHALVSYNLSGSRSGSGSGSGSVSGSGSGSGSCPGLDPAARVGFIPMPCSLTCAKLMNCGGKLIMVGGIGKSDVVKGIGVWELTPLTLTLTPPHGHARASEWKEVSRMPNKFFRGFGEFDDVFSSSGTQGLVYIHAFGSPQLLIFSLVDRTWRWSQKCPMVKKHPLHLFTGFCFEPRLGCIPLGRENIKKKA